MTIFFVTDQQYWWLYPFLCPRWYCVWENCHYTFPSCILNTWFFADIFFFSCFWDFLWKGLTISELIYIHYDVFVNSVCLESIQLLQYIFTCTFICNKNLPSLSILFQYCDNIEISLVNWSVSNQLNKVAAVRCFHKHYHIQNFKHPLTATELLEKFTIPVMAV